MRDILKTVIGLMDKRKAWNKSPMIRKGLEGKSHRLRAIQEIFEEGYVKTKNKEKKKKKRKSGMEGGCLSILRGAKEVSIKERHSKCQK